MKKTFIVIASTLIMLPLLVHADVITSDDLQRLTMDAQTQNNGCKLIDFALNEQGNMSEVPEWKTHQFSNGVVLRFPWSPKWYLVGKQIPWFDKTNESTYALGRFMPGEACGPIRQYSIEVVSNKTIKQRFQPPLEGEAEAVAMETMIINGRKVSLLEHPLSMCNEQSVAVEVKKGTRIHTVVITHRCGEVNAEMIRMAAGIK